MDHPRFDSLARVLARTSSPSRRAFLRLLLGGVAGGALTTPRPRSAAGQDDCKLGCPFGTICVNGACEEIAITAPCPAGCPPGFVCSGERCVEELPAGESCLGCASVVTCGATSTAGYCCEQPDYAVCLCESRPGAGDGFAGCCGGPENPCPSRIPPGAFGEFYTLAQGCDPADPFCQPFAMSRGQPGTCGGRGSTVACYHDRFHCPDGCGVCEICTLPDGAVDDPRMRCLPIPDCDPKTDCRVAGCPSGACQECSPWTGRCTSTCLHGTEVCAGGFCKPV